MTAPTPAATKAAPPSGASGGRAAGAAVGEGAADLTIRVWVVSWPQWHAIAQQSTPRTANVEARPLVHSIAQSAAAAAPAATGRIAPSAASTDLLRCRVSAICG